MPGGQAKEVYRREFGGAVARAQGPPEIDHALAHLGGGYLDEGAIELKPLAAIEEFEDEGLRIGLRHARRRTPLGMWRFLEKELHGNIENLGDLEQSAGADAVHALLVFLDLLKGEPHALAEALLAHAKQHPA